MRVAGKVALISGGPGGIGAAAAKEGAAVVIADLPEDEGRATETSITEPGGRALFVNLDVTSEDSRNSAVQFAVLSFDKLDILVNNAGVSHRTGVEKTTSEAWDNVMDVNAKGVFLGTKAAIPEMRKLGGGSIINISSVYGMVGSVTSAAYHASKGAVRIFSKSTAIQYASENIQANSVHPGFVDSPMTRAHHDNPNIHEERVAKMPLGRMGLSEDIAAGILYLASDESSFVTGAELRIYGGMTAQQSTQLGMDDVTNS